ncbi:hypothetical protein C0431_07635 [bacterium]|nr:hypothetical protein [bacterium]
MNDSSQSEYSHIIPRFTLRLAIILTTIAAVPWLLATLTAPSGSVYIGAQFSSDDQMVYSAWMYQAMQGQFLFDNRFAIEQQPGLTVHLYFWLLGTVSMLFKGAGAPFALVLVNNLARLVFTFLFVILLGRFVRKLDLPIYVAKTGMILATFGGGLGFMVWEAFGRLTSKQNFVAGMLEQRLPVDIWQPEVFVFSSSLVNGLFMVSLCLILTALTQVWEAQKSWRAVPLGAGAMFLLMNIHSYDVLIIAFTLIAFAVIHLCQKSLDKTWAIRALVIGLGAIPPALWFMNVLQSDQVFQARAATLTYSGTFRQLLCGILPLILLGLVSFQNQDDKSPKRWLAPSGILIVLVGLFLGATGYDPEKSYFLSTDLWGLAFVALVAPLFFAPRDPKWQILAAWGCVGLIIPYFPQLFQRKLAMGLVIPWGFLAAYGFQWLTAQIPMGKTTSEEGIRIRRNVISGVLFVLCCASSVFWFQRELLYIRHNITSTTVQPVFLPSDVNDISRELAKIPGRKVVIARPGIPGRTDENPWAEPYLPDLNPVFSGFAGAYSFAGHWSETPKYDERRYIAEGIFRPLDPAQIDQFLRDSQATHIVQPIPELFPDLPAGDLTQIGRVLYEGRSYRLIEVDRNRLEN